MAGSKETARIDFDFGTRSIPNGETNDIVGFVEVLANLSALYKLGLRPNLSGVIPNRRWDTFTITEPVLAKIRPKKWLNYLSRKTENSHPAKSQESTVCSMGGNGAIGGS